MNEFLKNEGRLAVLEKEASELELRLRGDIRAIRNCLDPLEDLVKIPAAEAAAQAVEFAEKHIQYISVLEKIKAVKEALGR
jgi:hypothetical protein